MRIIKDWAKMTRRLPSYGAAPLLAGHCHIAMPKANILPHPDLARNGQYMLSGHHIPIIWASNFE